MPTIELSKDEIIMLVNLFCWLDYACQDQYFIGDDEWTQKQYDSVANKFATFKKESEADNEID